ncbi:MAG: phosphatidate cytidylyltransferase, partial [Anaerolineae bacterium]
MIKTRVISALVLLPVVAVFVQVGGWLFFAGMASVALLATWEFIQLMRGKGHRPSVMVAFGLALGGLLSMQFSRPDWFVPAATAMFVVSLVWQLFQADSVAPVVDWALALAGGGYIGLGMGHLIGLRLLPLGYAWVWVALLGTWGCDTFAYFIGRAVGRHKFWPRVSPKKTWEGVF